MGRPNGREAKPNPEDETKPLPPVSSETVEMIALDPSEDPVNEFANPSFPLAFRGYDRRSVDAYVMRVTEVLAELYASRSPRAAVKRALDRVGRETAGILQSARDSADEVTQQSRARADERRQEAEREALRLRTEAEAHVRALDAATDEIWVERRRIVENTRILGVRLQALADDAAEEFPAETDGNGDGGARRGKPEPAQPEPAKREPEAAKREPEAAKRDPAP
jgi:cell division septum initiation protein DivIVA